MSHGEEYEHSLGNKYLHANNLMRTRIIYSIQTFFLTNVLLFLICVIVVEENKD